jgi:DNA-directed RNA polymerase alpha subunit
VIGFQDEEQHGSSDEKTDSTEAEVAEPDQEVLKTRIETLDLSPRTLEALEAASIRTIGGLVRKKKDDILALDGVGPKALEEIEDLLKEQNLTLEA